MQNIELKATVLEANEGTFEGNSYRNLVARYNGQLLKFKVEKSLSKIKDFIDEEVLLVCEVIKGSNMTATIRVVDVKEV